MTFVPTHLYRAPGSASWVPCEIESVDQHRCCIARSEDERGGMLLVSVHDVKSAAATLGRLGGRAKSAAKTKAVRANGKLGGRPNNWPDENGRRWTRVRLDSNGKLVWQCVDDDKTLIGLYDDDGEAYSQGNDSWHAVRSKRAPSWL